VPPFPGSVAKLFAPSAVFLRHGELYPMIAWRDGRPVGRIAAIVNRAHNRHYGDRTGFFGFFDFIDGEEVARALYEAAMAKLVSRGCDSVRGPYNPTINDEVGVLVEGFERPPFVMMPFNPAYYAATYERLGLKTAHDLYCFLIRRNQKIDDRITKIVGRVKRSTGLTLRTLDLGRLDQELRVIEMLYNKTLCRNWGFVPITYEELQFAAKDLKAIVDPEMVFIAEKNGAPVGFSMIIPNVNEYLWKARGSRSSLMRVLRFLWNLKFSRPKEVRVAVLGVLPEYSGSGIGSLFYYESLVRGRVKYEAAELSWVEDTNKDMMSGIALLGGEKYRTYRLYESALPGGH